jgi:hypothetical protein
MTTVAPLPGRETGAGDEGDAAAGGHDVVVRPDASADDTTTATSGPTPTDRFNTRTVSVAADTGNGPDATVDLTFHRPKAPANDPAGQASWVLGLALALLSEGAAERVAMAEVLAESAGRSRAIEGAYGRAVALLSEYPRDPLVHRTVDLLAKALLRSRRPARAEEA